mgnify:CR=1 FL=1
MITLLLKHLKMVSKKTDKIRDYERIEGNYVWQYFTNDRRIAVCCVGIDLYGDFHF